MSGAVVFRELTDDPADLVLLRAFHESVYVAEFPDPDERESLANMADYLRRKASGWYGANSYHIVLGLADDEIVAASISDYLATPNTGIIEFIVVVPAMRAAGLGRRLLTHTEDLLDQDARRAHGRQLDAVLAEMNDPLATSAQTDNVDPVTRALVWHRWGYRGVDFPYVQPPLTADQQAVTNLILICRPCRTDWADALPAPIVTSTVREYLRWAMRIDEPDHSAEFTRMADALARAEHVALLPLDRYTGHDQSFDVRPVSDDTEFGRAMALYRHTFADGPATVPESTFRTARTEPGYHLWTIRRTSADPTPEGLVSFFALPEAGFIGYVALTGSLHRAGLLRPLMARVDTQLLAERRSVRGCYAEVSSEVDITPHLRIGGRELAIDYRQPDPDLPLRLVFRPAGRCYGSPLLTVRELLTDIEHILITVYAIARPREHATYRRIADALPDPDANVPLLGRR